MARNKALLLKKNTCKKTPHITYVKLYMQWFYISNNPDVNRSYFYFYLNPKSNKSLKSITDYCQYSEIIRKLLPP